MKKTDLLMAELHTLYDSQIRKGKTKGSLRDMYVSDIPTAVWETYLLLPAQQRDWIAARRTALKEYVDWERSDEYLPKKAPLPIVIGSWRTAAEYQPSFFEFTQPQWDHQKSNPFGAERDTQLHRVDDSVYLYTNLMAVSSLYQIAADPQTANIYGQAAQQIKDNILRYIPDHLPFRPHPASTGRNAGSVKMCPELGHISCHYLSAQAHRFYTFVRADNRLRLYAVTTTE